MKLSSLFLISLLFFNVFPSYAAQPGEMPFYLVFDIGGNMLDRMEHAYSATTLHMEPGARADVALGFRFFESTPVALGAQLETGILYNGIDNGEVNGERQDVDGALIQVPLIVSATFRFLPHTDWNPYLAIGGGAVRSDLTIDWFWGGREFQPAAQLAAGLTYSGGDEALSFGIGYKCLAAYPDNLRANYNHAVVFVLGLGF